MNMNCRRVTGALDTVVSAIARVLSVASAGRSDARTWMDRLTAHLLTGSLLQLSEELRDRYREEWADHRTHLRGWRLVWWALCVRATASRTGQEFRPAWTARDEVSRIAGRKTNAGLWCVVLASGGAYTVALFSVLALTLKSTVEWVVWLVTVSSVMVSLTLARYVGRLARQATNPRIAVGLAACWFGMGVSQFVLRYLYIPSSAAFAGDTTEAAKATLQFAVLFLAIYLMTGAVAALQGFLQAKPTDLSATS
jgi:hypothetical protein